MRLFKFFAGTTNPDRRRSSSRRQWRDQNGVALRRGQHLCDQYEFIGLLYLERRRSERSSRPLCLILLNGIDIVDSVIRQSAFDRMFQRLRSSVRETDILGWYDQNNTLAIIFSNLESADDLTIQSLRTKTSNALAVALTPELLKCIRVSVHV